MTTREFLEARDFPACAYCMKARAVHREHVVPVAMRRRYHIAWDDARFHVPSCADCNLRKATLHLYPRGFDVSILPGNPKAWRGGDGDPATVHKAVTGGPSVRTPNKPAPTVATRGAPMD